MRQHHSIVVVFQLLMAMLLSAYGATAQFNAAKSDNQIAKADTLMERDDFAGALAIYTKVLESGKPSAEMANVLYKRAYCYYAVGKFQEALNDINRFIEKNPDQRAKILRAYIYQELGNNEAQLKDLNEFVASNPDDIELLRWRASVLMELEQFSAARSDIQKIMMVDQSPDIKGFLGLTYFYDGEPDSALMIFDQVIAAHPTHVQSYLYAASLALEKESYTLALDYINKGLRHDNTNTTLLFYKGIALVENDQTTEGCRCLTKAFSIGVDDAGDYLKQFCYGVE